MDTRRSRRSAQERFFLVYEIAFQRQNLQGRELVGKADKIKCIGDAVHDIERCGIHDEDTGIIAFHIVIGHDNGIAVCTGQRFRYGCAVCAAAHGDVTGHVVLPKTMEYTSVFREENIHGAAVGRQVYRAQTARILITAGGVNQGKQGDAVPVIDNRYGVYALAGKVDIALI